MRSSLVWGCCLWLAGCGASDGFERAVPDRSLLSLNVPGSTPTATTTTATASPVRQALVGAPAQFYLVTVKTTSDFNQGLAGFLAQLEHILTQPPSQHSATHAVWGPSNDALSPANYKLDVERPSPDAYGYGYSGKLKGAPDTDFQLVLEGENHIVDATHATGNIHADNDRARMLDPTITADQNLFVHYDNTGSARIVEIQFQKAGINDALYHYAENPDGSGSFQFAAPQDVDHDGTLETTAIVSRWLPSGAGRADVVAQGGSLTASQNMTECWDTSFSRTFYAENGHTIDGDPATCAF